MNRWKILTAWLATRFRPRFDSREALEQWQDAKVRQLLQHVLPRSAYYRELFHGRDPRDWRTFPCTSKTEMMANFSRLNTLGLDRDEAMALALKAEQTRDFEPTLQGVAVGLSSGTSGSRGLFVVSPDEQARWAGTVLAKVLDGSLLGFTPHRIAFFLRANNRLYTTLGSRKIRFEFFDLLEPLDQHLARLNALAPTLLVAPPSMLRMLAAELVSGTLRITPRKIVSVAEVLDPLDRQHIQEAFGQAVHQVYQATEGFLGTTCAHGTLHLAEDGVVVQREYLDAEQTRFTPIITDFLRFSQPIIRYRLNDVLVLKADPCPCGSVLTPLEFVEGRADDVFYLPTADHGSFVPVFPDFIRRAVIMSSGAIAQYAVRQLSPRNVEAFITVESGEDGTAVQQRITQELRQLWQRLGCLEPDIRFVPAWTAPPCSGKKLKRIERCFPPPSATENRIHGH